VGHSFACDSPDIEVAALSFHEHKSCSWFGDDYEDQIVWFPLDPRIISRLIGYKYHPLEIMEVIRVL